MSKSVVLPGGQLVEMFSWVCPDHGKECMALPSFVVAMPDADGSHIIYDGPDEQKADRVFQEAVTSA